MAQPFERLTLVDQLSQRIGDDILAGQYPPGSLLPPERDLAKDYGVTRTSLKHTLVRLGQAGLIETRHGVGSVVQDFESTAGAALLPLLLRAGVEGWLPEVFDIRRLCGALIAREAATRRSASDLAALNALVEDLRAASSPEEAQRLEAEVHRHLARATGNRVFVLVVNTILDAYLPFGAHLRTPFANPDRLATLLESVVAAVAERDPVRSEREADRYFAYTGAAMLGTDQP